ncbi:MAG: hypothetical protein NZ903_01665 [Candidatus Micrarchaeota archaeon]|nr:hypothetical protein [Candidatus Micrarchaeota archaeon]
MGEIQVKLDIGLSNFSGVKRKYVELRKRVRLGSLLIENIFKKKPKFTKEELAEAEEAWIRG